MDFKLFLLVVSTITSVTNASPGVDNWNCPCHLCKRVMNFAITILPSCPELKTLDQIFDANSLCHESSLSDISQDCIHFINKFYQNTGYLKRQLIKLQCFSRTEKEIEILCGKHHLACCDLINEP